MVLSSLRFIGLFFRRFRRSIAYLAGCVRGFLKDNRAVSTVEYALIVVAIVAIVGAAGATLSGAFGDLFKDLGDDLSDQADTLGGLDDKKDD